MPRTAPVKKIGLETPSDDFPLKDFDTFLALPQHHKNFVILMWLKPIKRWTNEYIYKRALNKPNVKTIGGPTNASRLLAKPEIKACLKKMDEYRLSRLNLTVDRLMEEECAIAFSDIGYLFDQDGWSLLSPAELPPEIRRAISGVEIKEREVNSTGEDGKPAKAIKRFYKYNLWDKGKALDRLAKIKGLYAPEKHEVSGPNGGPIPVAHLVRLEVLDDSELSALIKIAEKLKAQEAIDV